LIVAEVLEFSKSDKIMQYAVVLALLD